MKSFELTKILSTDGLDKAGIQILQDGGINVVEQKLSKSELIQQLSRYDAIIVRSATILDAEIINAVGSCSNNRLKVIARAGTGVDNIDVPAATKYDILVINTPAANTLSAAEHTCALLCSLPRNIPRAAASMMAGKWERKEFMGTELYGKSLAIVGLGRIGREVATRMRAFGMEIIGYDPIINSAQAEKFNVKWMELNDIWKKADYVTIHVPLLPQTENLVDKRVFYCCKTGVKFVNCSRGGIINENDLLEALNTGKCSGAALDVFVDEPPTNKALICHPKLIATPHLGASTKEAQKRVAEEIATNLVALKTGKGQFGVVNA